MAIVQLDTFSGTRAASATFAVGLILLNADSEGIWRMKKILVATDFSVRSDRAIRRAVLLAKRFEASISLIHAIDNDQPKCIVEAERIAASALLNEQAGSLRKIDGVDCFSIIVLGDPFEEIVRAYEEIAADLLVIGPHRRQTLKDVFIGTTAERIIRTSRRPVLMANGVPADFYRHVLVAVDLSDCSREALRAVMSVKLEKHAAVSVIHVFDAPATGLIAQSGMTDDQLQARLADEEKRVSGELTAFLRPMGLSPIREILRAGEGFTANAIDSVAREISADLVVVGTHGRTGLAKLLLGSVAEELLRTADYDVLAAPPLRGS